MVSRVARAQMEARSHPSMVEVMEALLGMWRSEEDPTTDLSTPLMYVDRVRRRAPWSRWVLGGRGPLELRLHLPTHMDGGSEERWTDPEYRKVHSVPLKQ